MEALAALPPTTAVDPKEIDDLKSQNKHNLADSLANVKRLLDSTNFIEFMLTALQPLQQVGYLFKISPPQKKSSLDWNAITLAGFFFQT